MPKVKSVAQWRKMGALMRERKLTRGEFGKRVRRQVRQVAATRRPRGHEACSEIQALMMRHRVRGQTFPWGYPTSEQAGIQRRGSGRKGVRRA
jgi:hypothetical protein